MISGVNDMENKIFRKKSLDRIASPEQLTDYIKVSNPSVWIILGAASILLISVLIWSAFGTLPTTLKVTAYVKDGVSVCYVDSDTATKIISGMETKISNVTGKVIAVSTTPASLAELNKKYGDADTAKLLSAGTLNYPITSQIPGVANGIYEMVITIDNAKPISFILN